MEQVWGAPDWGRVNRIVGPPDSGSAHPAYRSLYRVPIPIRARSLGRHRISRRTLLPRRQYLAADRAAWVPHPRIYFLQLIGQVR